MPAMNPYVAFMLYLIAILGFVASRLLMNRMLGPKPMASAMKLEPFECGATPIDTRNVKADADQVLRGRHRLHAVRPGDRVPLHLGTGAQPLTGFMLLTFFIFAFLLVAILLYVYKARLLESVTE